MALALVDFPEFDERVLVPWREKLAGEMSDEFTPSARVKRRHFLTK
jgi:hypothetical protein